eukprot:jgi/Botrbrau1/11886/Bobra.126_2s0019.1
METISEKEVATPGARSLVIAIDDSSECERAVGWTVENLVRPGDEVHLVHVIPRMQVASMYPGAPPVDFLPQQDPLSYEQLIKNAEHFITQRFLPKLGNLEPSPVVHVVRADVDTDSIGNVVCRKVDELKATALIMASHSKTKLQEFFLGSVTNFCTHHCRKPVLVVK